LFTTFWLSKQVITVHSIVDSQTEDPTALATQRAVPVSRYPGEQATAANSPVTLPELIEFELATAGKSAQVAGAQAVFGPVASSPSARV